MSTNQKNQAFDFEKCRASIRSAKISRLVFILILVASLVTSLSLLVRDVTTYDMATLRYENAMDEYYAFQNEDRAALSVEAGENIVYIDIEKYGLIAVELDPENAPITVANFKKLAKEGFYDGLIFHRVIEGFMIQGGGMNELGQSKSASTIKGEFSANGVDNKLDHVAGVISMARGGSYDSANSQFFIVHKTSSNNTKSLDGKYAAFGKVVVGMDIVDKIARVETNSSDRPYDSVVIRTVTMNKKDVENPVLPPEPLSPSVLQYFLATFIAGGVALVGCILTIVSALWLHKEKLALAKATETERIAEAERRKEAARQRQLEGKNKKKN